MGRVGAAWNYGKDMIFPVHCVKCNAEGSVFCLFCKVNYAVQNPSLSCPFCRKEKTGGTVCIDCRKETYLDGLVAMGNYADPVLRKLIALWKYDGNKKAGEELLSLMRKCHIYLPEGIGAVCPVALSKKRKKARGFDQSLVIAMELGGLRSIPVRQLLTRMKDMPSRAKMQAKDRLIGDLDHVFTCEKAMEGSVLLCDDVFTSGSTMDAAARTLKAAGAERVWGFVLAKGGS